MLLNIQFCRRRLCLYNSRDLLSMDNILLDNRVLCLCSLFSKVGNFLPVISPTHRIHRRLCRLIPRNRP